MEKKKVIYRTEITPTNLKAMFNIIATLYSKVVKTYKGKMKFSISEDEKGFQLSIRIPKLDMSKNLISLLKIYIDKYRSKDTYLRMKDEIED